MYHMNIYHLADGSDKIVPGGIDDYIVWLCL